MGVWVRRGVCSGPSHRRDEDRRALGGRARSGGVGGTGEELKESAECSMRRASGVSQLARHQSETPPYSPARAGGGAGEYGPATWGVPSLTSMRVISTLR